MENIWLALLLSTALALLAVWRRALTPAAVILAWAFSVVITLFGGLWSFVTLASTFVFTIAAGKISGKRRENIEKELHAKTGQRDAVQIICNVGTGALMTVVYAVTKDDAFLFAYGAAMAASLADSMASEMGILSRRSPVDICTFKHVRAGLSGGVTLLGLAMSLIGAGINAAVFAFPMKLGFSAFAVVALCGFAGALLDSVLGSALQAKYRCTQCGELTEKKIHCGQEAQLTKGVGFMTNDAVNLINNVFSALLALVIFA